MAGSGFKEISHGSRRLSLAVTQLFLEELSRPLSHWIIRTSAVQPQATALHAHALLLEPYQPSSPLGDGSCESAHDGVCTPL